MGSFFGGGDELLDGWLDGGIMINWMRVRIHVK